MGLEKRGLDCFVGLGFFYLGALLGIWYSYVLVAIVSCRSDGSPIFALLWLYAQPSSTTFGFEVLSSTIFALRKYPKANLTCG